jgi:hypothetical protein
MWSTPQLPSASCTLNWQTLRSALNVHVHGLVCQILRIAMWTTPWTRFLQQVGISVECLWCISATASWVHYSCWPPISADSSLCLLHTNFYPSPQLTTNHCQQTPPPSTDSPPISTNILHPVESMEIVRFFPCHSSPLLPHSLAGRLTTNLLSAVESMETWSTVSRFLLGWSG